MSRQSSSSTSEPELSTTKQWKFLPPRSFSSSSTRFRSQEQFFFQYSSFSSSYSATRTVNFLFICFNTAVVERRRSSNTKLRLLLHIIRAKRIQFDESKHGNWGESENNSEKKSEKVITPKINESRYSTHVWMILEKVFLKVQTYHVHISCIRTAVANNIRLRKLV